MKNYLYIGLVGGAMLLAGCGALENKADNVLGLDETTMSECVKDLAACAKLAERAQSLSFGHAGGRPGFQCGSCEAEIRMGAAA